MYWDVAPSPFNRLTRRQVRVNRATELRGNPLLVAVVDDDEAVRRAFVRLLRSADFDALSFASARAFLSAFYALNVDCVVVDLHMPEMTGLDLQIHLRSTHPDATPPVLILTGHDDPDVRARCIAAGAQAFLQKPVDSETLLQEIRRLTGERGGAPSV
jgi:FixJ family two-component response regulator